MTSNKRVFNEECSSDPSENYLLPKELYESYRKLLSEGFFPKVDQEHFRRIGDALLNHLESINVQLPLIQGLENTQGTLDNEIVEKIKNTETLDLNFLKKAYVYLLSFLKNESLKYKNKKAGYIAQLIVNLQCAIWVLNLMLSYIPDIDKDAPLGSYEIGPELSYEMDRYYDGSLEINSFGKPITGKINRATELKVSNSTKSRSIRKIKANSNISVLVSSGKWAYIYYITQENQTQFGWVQKKNIDIDKELKPLKRKLLKPNPWTSKLYKITKKLNGE